MTPVERFIANEGTAVDILTKFNKYVMGMILGMIDLIPYSGFVSKGTIKRRLIEHCTPRNTKLIEQFILEVLEYKEEINNFDEDFFLREEFERTVETRVAQKTNTSIGEFLTRIRGRWNGLHDDKKREIFMDLQNLCGYAEEYFLLIYA